MGTIKVYHASDYETYVDFIKEDGKWSYITWNEDLDYQDNDPYLYDGNYDIENMELILLLEWED